MRMGNTVMEQSMKVLAPIVVAVAFLCGGVSEAGLDYYKYLRYPAKLDPTVGRDKVSQEGGPNAKGYQRRTVQWHPRKGHDIVDIPKGAPMRTWTRNKGQFDPEYQAGLCRNWTASDGGTFKAHLIGFRGFGVDTRDPRHDCLLAPTAVLRMENGQRRGVNVYKPFSLMLSEEDHAFIHKIWKREFKKITAAVSPIKYDAPHPWVDPRMTVKVRSDHFLIRSPGVTEHKTLWWLRPHEPEKQEMFRKGSIEFAENMWSHIEVAGSTMPYWRCGGDPTPYVITVQLKVSGNLGGGGYAHCGLRDNGGGPRNVGLSHEFYHGHPTGGWDLWTFGETTCNQGAHFNLPGEMLMFSSNFAHPWRNVNCSQYQSALLYVALGDSPHWGYGAASVIASLASLAEQTPYHTIARLGQARGLWKNGVKGFGDFFGEYAARIVTCDFVLQHPLRSKYGMPTLSSLEPIYGRKNSYRIPNAEAPRTYGFNIVRLLPNAGATQITADFNGLYEPLQYSDWRASMVAVDAKGRARYSPQWSKGEMTLEFEDSDKHFWLVVAATPSAMPLSETNWSDGKVSRPVMESNLMGAHTRRYPWEVTLTGCRPGSPHRRQGDVVNYDEMYAVNSGNRLTDISVRHEAPTPLSDSDGALVQTKLKDLARRIAASQAACHKKRKNQPGGDYDSDHWWEHRKIQVLGDMARRVKFLQRNAKGRRHVNGGGFVSDNARAAASAYVGPDAMVLDGARVEGSACIKGHAIVIGEKTVVRGNAKIGGKAWVCGDLVIEGNARILESATVITTWRERDKRSDGRAKITGNAVIKGEHVLKLCYADDQRLTGGLVMDYTPGVDGTLYYWLPGFRSITTYVPGVENHDNGVYDRGRIYKNQKLADGKYAGSLYADWRFNQPKTTMLEDSYVNNNGVLRGRPTLGRTDDTQRKFIVFNGKDQYAEVPSSVADFGELTIDMMINRSGGGRLFDFGTGDDECFHLAIDAKNGKPSLGAKHKGKSYSLAAAQGVPAGKWIRLRIEMDGTTASIYIEGKRVARGAFAFSPRSVFIGDRAEGNFIACGRNRSDFFAGKMDHFRIYRAVHKDFEALGSAPSAITQLQEWSQADQRKADAWEARKLVAQGRLMTGQYGRLHQEIERHMKEKQQVLRKLYDIDNLEARAKKADETLRQMHREINEAARAKPEIVELEKTIAELRKQLNVITSEIRKNAEYVKLERQVKACEKQLHQVDANARAIGEYKALADRIKTANRTKESARKRIEDLPQLTRLAEQVKKEKDGSKRRKLQQQHSHMSQQLTAADLQYQQASVASARMNRVFHKMLRYKVRTDRRRLEPRFNLLRKDRNKLLARLTANHSQAADLQKQIAAKQQRLTAVRKSIQDRIGAKDVYKDAEQKRHVATRTFDRPNLPRPQPSAKHHHNKEIKRLGAQIANLRKQANRIRDAAFKAAGVSGDNPYPGSEAAELWDHQQNLTHHTTADWDTRTREELENRVTPVFKEWLLRVRGY